MKKLLSKEQTLEAKNLMLACNIPLENDSYSIDFLKDVQTHFGNVYTIVVLGMNDRGLPITYFRQG
jgi:hypothetical protein